MKCLVTKLQATVNNSRLPILGAIKTEVTSWASSFSMVILEFEGSGKCVLSGDLSFSDNTTEAEGERIEKTIVAGGSGTITIKDAANLKTFYLINSGCATDIEGLLDAVNLEIFDVGQYPASTGATFKSANQCTFNVEKLPFTKLTKLHLAGCGNLSGNISQVIRNNPHLTELSLAGTRVELDLDCLANMTSLVVSCLPPAIRVRGDIKYFGDTASTNLISAGRSNFVSGTLESIVERARSHGRTSGQITIQYGSEWSTLTFNGTPLSELGLATGNTPAYLKWTASTIELDNTPQ